MKMQSNHNYHRKTKHILLAGLIYDNNLGDQAIYLSTRKMVEEAVNALGIPNVKIDVVDITGRLGAGLSQKAIIQKLCLKFIRKFRQYFWGKEKARNYSRVDTAKMVSLLNINKNTSAIIFVGGGIIKFKYQYFHVYLNVITQYAEKYNIPVMFSGVGIEGYDEHHPDCMTLKEMLNRKCIKVITTRDDFECLNNNYIFRSDIITARVADPACSFAMFNPLTEIEKNNCIGLGVVREGLFEDNGIAFSKIEMLKLWSDIYFKILENGYECKLFCNGAKSDFRFLEELKEYIVNVSNITPDYMTRPLTVKQLTDGICNCAGLIVGRLHASILAYAYDIPCVSLVWNHKQTMFGEQTGHKKYFIKANEFNADLIITRLIDAMAEKTDMGSKQQYCSTTHKYIQNFLEEYCLER